jgi:hypothetical protein
MRLNCSLEARDPGQILRRNPGKQQRSSLKLPFADPDRNAETRKEDRCADGDGQQRRCLRYGIIDSRCCAGAIWVTELMTRVVNGATLMVIPNPSMSTAGKYVIQYDPPTPGRAKRTNPPAATRGPIMRAFALRIALQDHRPIGRAGTSTGPSAARCSTSPSWGIVLSLNEV